MKDVSLCAETRLPGAHLQELAPTSEALFVATTIGTAF